MSDYHINIFWSEDDGSYVADIPEELLVPRDENRGGLPGEDLQEVGILVIAGNRHVLHLNDDTRRGNISQDDVHFGGGEPMPTSDLLTPQHFTVFGEQRDGDQEPETASQHPVENPRGR